MAVELQEALIAAAREGKKSTDVVNFAQIPAEVRPAVIELLGGLLANAARQVAAPAPLAPPLSTSIPFVPRITRLTEAARRFGEAGEIFGPHLLGPEANRLTWGVQIPEDWTPPIRFPLAFLERCKQAGALLCLHSDKAWDGSTLSMFSMCYLILERSARECKGRLLYSNGEGSRNQRFFNSESPRSGWRVVFPNVLTGTPDKNDLDQTDLLIAQLSRFFEGTPMPELYEKAIAEFRTRREEIGNWMSGKSDKDRQKASEAIEKLQFSQIARPTPVEVLDVMAVSWDNLDKRPFSDFATRTPRRSSLIGIDCGLVDIGPFRDDHGAPVRGEWGPGLKRPNLGASLSLQSW